MGRTFPKQQLIGFKLLICPSLLELQLSFCQLNYLPKNFPSANFMSVSVLDLSANVFSSSIPQWVFNFTFLTNLQLSYCLFIGSIPKIAKGNLCKLPTLALSDNNLSGEITEFFQALLECSNSSLCWKNTCLYRIQNIRSKKSTDLLHSQLITCTMQISEFKNK